MHDPRPSLLAALDGRWTMRGDVMGKPVTYDLEAGPVLGGAFTELHMKDVSDPPQYEAQVFLGFDRESGTLIAHWLDRFGALASIPHGTGGIHGNRVRFIVPYEKTCFRDTLDYDETKGSWRLVIEAGDGEGGWKHFAGYEIVRKEGRE